MIGGVEAQGLLGWRGNMLRTTLVQESDRLAELASQVAQMRVAADTIWVLVTAMLVFFMNLGFACVESGMCRSRNAVNILSKNFIVFAVSSLGFWALGFGLMFGEGGRGLWFASGADNSPATGDSYAGVYPALNWTGVPLWAKFFFQLVFCGTAATIVSGVVAERIKYSSFILFSLILTAVIYPIVGKWIWGGGFLQERGFADFAGSTQVHSVGGWAALAGVLLLGPRIGKYGPRGQVHPIPGHNMSLATLGTFVLWFGWFGFNPGSTMAADPPAIAEICMTTNTAAIMAALTATLTCWIIMGKPDLGMTLNGSLAGLVAITASCAFVTVAHSAVIGSIAGVLVVLSVMFWDRLKIDDPVGALSVHLVNGVFGTLCVGLFADPGRIRSRTGNAHASGGLFTGGGTDQLVDQLIGIVATAVFVFAIAFAAWRILKATLGIRVPAEEETAGLDLGEHGMHAYPEFQIVAGAESRGEPR
jgi:Amt family ammonium transporter